MQLNVYDDKKILFAKFMEVKFKIIRVLCLSKTMFLYNKKYYKELESLK